MYHATQHKGAEYISKRKANFFHQDDNELMHVVNLANVLKFLNLLIINLRRIKSTQKSIHMLEYCSLVDTDILNP